MKKIILILLLSPLFIHAQVSSYQYIAAPGPPGVYTASPTSLSGITCVNGGSNSTPASFTLSGTFITNTSTIAQTSGTTGLQFCFTSGGTYTSTLSATAFSGGITGQPITVYVQALSSSAVNSYSGSISITSTSATTLIIPVTWTVTSGASLSVSPTAIYPTSVAGTQGAGVMATVIGAGLGTNVATVPIPPSGYVQSLDDATWVSTALTLTPTSGSLNVPIWIALTAGNSAGTNDVTTTITDAGAGVSGAVLTLNGTTSASSTGVLFYFSRTAYTAPTISGITEVNIYGDPYYNILSGSGGGYTLTTGSTSAWQATGSPLIASSDSVGMTGSTFTDCPDPVLYHGLFTVSAPNRLADSANQTLSKPNLVLTGCAIGVSRTITIYSSINTRYSFTTVVKFRAVGSTTYVPAATTTLKGNTTVATTFTIMPDGTGTIKGYLFTDSSPSNINEISAELVQ